MRQQWVLLDERAHSASVARLHNAGDDQRTHDALSFDLYRSRKASCLYLRSGESR